MRTLRLILRACQLLLWAATAALVLWAFCYVGMRWWRERRSQGSHATLTALYWTNDELEAQIVQSQARDYEKQHPDVKVHCVAVQYGNFPAKLRTLYAAGTPPDLFYVPSALFVPLATMNLLHPLDGYVAQERAAGRDAWLDDLYPQLVKAFRFDGRATGRGPLLGIPKDCSTVVMWVNVDLFRQAHLPVPYNGWRWDQFESDMKAIRRLSTPEHPIYGGTLDLSSDSFRNILWTYGGDYFATHHGVADFREVQLDQPPAQQAMEMVRRVRLRDKTVYNATFPQDMYQLFMAGDIGTLGPIGRWKAPEFRQITGFVVDCVPVPYQVKPASQLYTTSWSIASSSRHPAEAFDLIRFLCGPRGEATMSRQGLSIPAMRSIAESDAFLSPGQVPAHGQIFLDQLKVAPLAQMPDQEPEWDRIVQNQVLDRCLQLGDTTPQQAAQEAAAAWLRTLDSPLQRTYPQVNWRRTAEVALAGLLLVVILLVWMSRREQMGVLDRRMEFTGWLLVSPWVLGFLVLTLGPMVASLLLSFTKWTALTPLSAAQFLGWQNYRELATRDPAFLTSLRVTVAYVLLAVPVGQAAALALALLLDYKLRGITLFRTAYFVPSVVSGVALSTLWLWIFNNDYGLLNAVLRPLLSLVGRSPPDWLGADARRWAIPAFVLMGLWSVGGGMVIYLAALKGVPEQLYEAARLDGAGASRRLWNVTLPSLSPIIFYNIIMAIIGSFQIFTQAKVMTDGGPNNATLFYVLNLYRQAFDYQNMGYASAMAWVLFLLILAVTLVAFRASRGLVHFEGLKI